MKIGSRSMLMKILLSITFILLSNFAFSQIDLQGQLYAKIKLDNIQLKDSPGNSIDYKQSLYPIFFRSDTAMHCFSEPKEKFTNMEYWPGGISSYKMLKSLEIKPNNIDPNLIDLIRDSFSWNGELIEHQYIFSIDGEHVENRTILNDSFSIDNSIVNDQGSCWRIKNIELDDDSFSIDSCHHKYQLVISGNGFFQQNYGSENSKCTCSIEESISNGMPHFISADSIYHEITIQRGLIRTYSNEMILSANSKDDLLVYKYKIEHGMLKLRNENGYLIILEKDLGCNIR